MKKNVEGFLTSLQKIGSNKEEVLHFLVYIKLGQNSLDGESLADLCKRRGYYYNQGNVLPNVLYDLACLYVGMTRIRSISSMKKLYLDTMNEILEWYEIPYEVTDSDWISIATLNQRADESLDSISTEQYYNKLCDLLNQKT